MKAGGPGLIRNVIWTYGAQVASVLLQLGYASATARLLWPSAFGQYAVALAATGLIALLATGGLGQAVARASALRDEEIGSVFAASLLFGSGAAGCLVLLAGPWAALWGSPAAASLIQVAALSALLSPALGLLGGVLRREGMFRYVAVTSFVSNCLGLVVGFVVVFVTRESWALLVPAIASTWLLVVLSAARLPGGALRPRNPFRARSILKFGSAVTLESMIAYAVGNIPKIGMSNLLGTSVLGQWNRGEVLASVPIQQMQAAVLSVIYPEFRHHQTDRAHTQEVWTRMLTLLVWIFLPVAGIAWSVLPPVALALFGQKFAPVAGITGLLCLGACVQLISVVLLSAIESLGRFKPIWATDLVLVIVQLIGLLVATWVASLEVFAVLFVCTGLVRHLCHVAWATSRGFLAWRRLRSAYARAVGAGLALGLAGEALRGSAPLAGWTHWYVNVLVLALSVLLLGVSVGRPSRHPLRRGLNQYLGRNSRGI